MVDAIAPIRVADQVAKSIAFTKTALGYQEPCGIRMNRSSDS